MSRKIDALVAERVMGLHVEPNLMHTDVVCADIVLVSPERGENSGKRWDGPRRPVPAYSTSISAAREVVEHGDAPGSSWLFHRVWGWNVVVYTPPGQPKDPHMRSYEGAYETLECAICIARLRAVGVTEAEIQEALRE